jgi:SAM-dependent methyltransferase
LYKSQELSRLYKIRFADKFLYRKNAVWKVIVKHCLQEFMGGGIVVDVACGYGEFINNVEAKRKIAIDLNADALSFLAKDVEFHCCDAFRLKEIVKGEADVVFTSNFLEHLPDKNALRRFLGDVFLSLKEGGRYIALGPNIRCLPGAYWDYFDHNIPLTHVSLSEALCLSGFDILRCFDRFLPYSFKDSLPTHPFLVWLYLNFPLAWKILGRQFLIVAEKRKALNPEL